MCKWKRNNSALIFKILAAGLLSTSIWAGQAMFSASAQKIAVYDFVEVTIRVPAHGGNCFTDDEVTGQLTSEYGAPEAIRGFCDAADGSQYRIRFLASKPGQYRYAVTLHTSQGPQEDKGTFTAEPKGHRGLVRVDAGHPFHFVWEGTGEHFFWNGLTTYALMGWQDEARIRLIIDRAADLKVNHLRVSLNGPRVADASRWYEPVKPSSEFHFLFGPWVAAHSEQVSDPGWDVTRFDIRFWQRYERMVAYARSRNVTISVIFFLDGKDAGADPFGKAHAFGSDEKRYYAYVAARLAAYSNVTWDLTNEWHLFRSAWWVEQMGTYLKALDPWKHLMSCHGRDQFPWAVSSWPDFAMFQLWDEEGGYQPMLARRTRQVETGRPMPQINEEYGYEDHYPVEWGGNRRSPARSADNRRRLAWEIAMAGCYGTTGERANAGNGSLLASPGGWINGGFDSSMHLLEGYARMVTFFTSIDYWKMDPMPQSPDAKVLILAEPGRRYALYLRSSTNEPIDLAPGKYSGHWYNPRTGQWSDAGHTQVLPGSRWTTPVPPGEGDWALLLEVAG